mmetsp:Transcript_9916/g.11550  ORF Transcript_9916/g.11550 Transcript_9916/m.11550 type:complete len:363 (-) Transcript_9916:138-1226(-)
MVNFRNSNSILIFFSVMHIQLIMLYAFIAHPCINTSNFISRRNNAGQLLVSNEKINNSNNDVIVTSSASSSVEKKTNNDNISTEENLKPSSTLTPTTKTSSPSSPIFQSRPSPELMMRALNTSPRRIFLSTLSASTIGLTSNFCGVTSNILKYVPENSVEKTGLDLFYPRGDMKRFKSGEHQYTFLVPKEWVQDTAVELAKAQSKTRQLDYSMRKSNLGSIPDSAYGPPGYFNEKGVSQSDTNVSTLVSSVRPGFTLRSLGSPTEAAQTLLRVSLAPEGSGRVATLLAACEEVRGESNLYQFEYTIDRGAKGVPLKAISIIAVRDGDVLVTMTVVAPEKDWEGDEKYERKLRTIAESFKLTK